MRWFLNNNKKIIKRERKTIKGEIRGGREKGKKGKDMKPYRKS